MHNGAFVQQIFVEIAHKGESFILEVTQIPCSGVFFKINQKPFLNTSLSVKL